MDIQKQITNFEKEFKALLSYEEQINQLAVEKFREKLLELQPIIQHMIKNGIYFTHPDLPHSKTTVGVIIGKNHQNERYIYVYDGVDMVVKEVDTVANDRVAVADKKVTFYTFFSNCNYEFALRGINHTKEAFPRIIESIKKELDEKRAFIEAL